ncbi:MAG: energy-coupling factor transporter transmembrane component T [Anaerolineaceae bacterium]|nr:energy-coupling factor transporter transmembrane component T [Anaerolineaceae bacterium]
MKTDKMISLDVRLKVLFFIVMVVLVFFFNNPFYNLGLLAVLVAVMLWGKLPLSGFWGMMKPMLPVFIIILVFTLFTKPYGLPQKYSEQVLFHLLPGNKMPATFGSLMLGINFLLRIMMMIAITYIFISSTPIDDILLLMNQLKAPYSLSILITTAITFIPTMNHKKDLIYQAQRSRGATINQKGIFGQLQSFVPIMVPLITNSILMANNLAIAMTNRGYGASSQMTMMKDLRFSGKDKVLLALTIFLFIAALILRFGLRHGLL